MKTDWGQLQGTRMVALTLSLRMINVFKNNLDVAKGNSGFLKITYAVTVNVLR